MIVMCLTCHVTILPSIGGGGGGGGGSKVRKVGNTI